MLSRRGGFADILPKLDIVTHTQTRPSVGKQTRATGSHASINNTFADASFFGVYA